MSERFKAAMSPALLLGALINGTNIILFLSLGAYQAAISPIIAAVIFVGLYYSLQFKRIKAKHSYLIGAYIVLFEVILHTYFLGFHQGFYYFVFLLPIIFFLNSYWRPFEMYGFVASLVLVLFISYYFFVDTSPIYPLSNLQKNLVQFYNSAGTGIAIIVVLIFYNRLLMRKDEELLAANLELAIRNREISKQHDHLQLLLKEVHHRVKNNLQIISSLISLQQHVVENDDFAEILDQTKQRVAAIALVHQKLYRDGEFDRVNFKAYLNDIILSQQVVNENVVYSVETEEFNLDLDTAIPLGLIVSELIMNALKHGLVDIEEPLLTIRCFQQNNEHTLVVQDNGIGLPYDFSFENPTSLGTELIVALTEQIKGDISFKNNNGAQFTIQFND